MFTEFLTQNILWVGAFVVVANLLLLSFLQGNIKGVAFVAALQLPQLQRGGKSIIIDVNNVSDFVTSHIPGAVNFPLDSIKADNTKLLKLKNKTAIIVCQTGSKSAKAAKQLLALEFSDLHILRGGLAAWNKENLPVSTG